MDEGKFRSASNYVTLIGMNDLKQVDDITTPEIDFLDYDFNVDQILQLVDSQNNDNEVFLNNDYLKQSNDTNDSCVTLNLGTDDLQCINHLKHYSAYNQIQEEIIRNNANNEPNKRRRLLKIKKYEAPPSSNAGEELKRQKAILAKKNRDDKKRQKENLETTIKELRLSIAKKNSQLADANTKIKMLETIKKSYAGTLDSVHHLVKNFGSSCKE